MAIRRRLAAAQGRPAPTRGPLDGEERAELVPALTTLCEALGLPGSVQAAALSVSARRDRPEAARLLLAHFEAEGATPAAG